MYENFEKVLKSKGLKVADICKITHIGASTFSDWKYGRSVPKTEKMKKIADSLGVSIEYLTTGKDAPNFVMPNYDSREHDLIEMFGNLYPEQKDSILKVVAELNKTRNKIDFYNHAKSLEVKMSNVINNCYDTRNELMYYETDGLFECIGEEEGIKYYKVSESYFIDLQELLDSVIHLIDNFSYGLN